MKAVITGATGHAGGTLARTLVARGHEVRAIVRSNTTGLKGLDVETVEADVRSVETLERACRGAEVVFHAAGLISITRTDAAAVFETNLRGTENVVSACRRAGVRRLVHFSSIEALDPRPFEVPVDEDRPYVDGSAWSPYAVSKARAEAAVRGAADAGLEAVILNPTAMIGPYDFKPSLLGRAIVDLANGRLPVLVEGGFDWVDVRDVAEAAVAAAERAPSGSRYIVGGRWASMAELAELACQFTGAPAPRLMCPFFLARAWAPVSTAWCRLTGKSPRFTSYTLRVLRGNRAVSHARATRELGYHPRELRETIRDTCEWFRQTGLLPPS